MTYRDVTWGMTAAERALVCHARYRRLSDDAWRLLLRVVAARPSFGGHGSRWHPDTPATRRLLDDELEDLVYEAPNNVPSRAGCLFLWDTRAGLLLVSWWRRWVAPRRIEVG